MQKGKNGVGEGSSIDRRLKVIKGLGKNAQYHSNCDAGGRCQKTGVKSQGTKGPRDQGTKGPTRSMWHLQVIFSIAICCVPEGSVPSL
jgi:hypothetical protein